MADKPQSRAKKILLWALTSPVTLIFGALMLYCGIQAYVLGNSPWQNKIIMAAIAAAWVLWLVFKNLIKFILLALIAGGLFYGYYRFENREEIACKEQGRVWNKEERTCEDKTGWKEKLEQLWQQYIGSKEEKATDKQETPSSGASK